jgi:hypothetical protein
VDAVKFVVDHPRWRVVLARNARRHGEFLHWSHHVRAILNTVSSVCAG